MSQSNLDLSKVLVLIPALDEESTIEKVIGELKDLEFTNILVVDNGSTDQTVSKARQAGAEVIVESRKGYGQACWTGLQNLKPEIEWILFCDADGSDDLSEIPLFLAETEEHDFILGNRRATAEGRGALTFVQNFGNWLSTRLIRLGWGKTFEDLGPLRLIKRDTLEKISMEDRGFGWTVEMQAKAAELNTSSIEVPVRYFPRKGGRSKISGTIRGSVTAGSVILSTLGKLYLRKLGKKTETKPFQIIAQTLSAFLLLCGAFLMIPHGDFLQPTSVPGFLTGASVMSLGFFLAWFIRSVPLTLFWGVAIGTRLLLLAMFPGDDVWRYLWEGLIQSHGYSPYATPPSSEALVHLHTDFWHLINHKEVSAVYPPLTQLFFRFFSAISPSVFVFKAFFIFADLITCYLLSRRFDPTRSIVYAWNPLTIYCIAGGAHYDSLFVLALVIGWLLFDDGKWKWSALALGCSVAIKWVSLPILAYVIWQSLRQKNFKYAFVAGVISTLPLVISTTIVCWGNWGHSLVAGDFALYARSSEFIPYFVAILWEDSSWRNWIFSIPLALIVIWFGLTQKKLHQFSERFFFTLYVLSPAIHAWYFVWITPFCVKSRNFGSRIICITIFVYFMLQYRRAIGDHSWIQPLSEKFFIWIPFIVAFLIHLSLFEKNDPDDNTNTLPDAEGPNSRNR